ncbi:MAG: energy transducer TonB [Bacteroidota bacterium]
MKNLLNKWLKGEVAWKEEKRLRQAAQNDDFLAEALEGYDAFSESDHTVAIDRLNKRLLKTKSTKKTPIFTLPRVAAAAALIGAITTFIWVQNQVRQPTTLSETTEDASAPAIEPPAVPPQPREIITTNESAPEKVATSSQPTASKKDVDRPSTTPLLDPVESIAEVTKAEQYASTKEKAVADAPTTVSNTTTPIITKSANTISSNNQQLLTEEMPEEEIAAAADVPKIARKVPSTPEPPTIYAQTEEPSTLAKGRSANVKAKKRTTIKPQPQEGFTSLLTYLKNNLIYPKNAKAAGIERKVEIQFFIDANGRPTNLKAVNPDPYGFDKEAIRLLENGPKWMPVNTSAKYFINFDMKQRE